jgi:hypothetical protein
MTRVNWEKEMTQDDFLEGLSRTRGISSSPRQLNELRNKGWLPELQRRSCPGTKSSVYVWGEQALDLFDLLQVSRADHWVRLALWLRGYQVDFAPIRQRWLDSIDVYLQALTQGESDDPLDNINDLVYDEPGGLKSKWEHTPTRYRPEPMRRLGVDKYAQFTELFWDALLVPGLNEAMFAEVLVALQMIDISGGDTQLPGEFAESLLPWLRILQEVLAMPRLREAIEQATPEAWEQARLDYETLCEFCRTFFAPAIQTHPKGVFLLQFVGFGFYLVPVALAVEYRGYGHWIDDAIAWANEFLSDPDLQAWIAEQLAQRRAKSPR